MNCFTKSIDPLGREIIIEKRKYNTLDEAIEVAKSINLKENRELKLVAYKCRYCFKYHIGKNGKIVKMKDRERIKKERIWKK
jgi:hypothetical protein